MQPATDVISYVPVDYIKARIKGVHKKWFFSNGLLNFIPVLDEGGEIRHYYAMYRGLKVKIYAQGTITLQGSLHKYWNYGQHNYNDFSRSGFDEVIQSLRVTLGIEPSQLHITCMEVGVNIVPPVKTASVLNNIFMHKGKDVEQRMSNDHAKFHCVEHDKFVIKLYDKAKQYRLPIDLMRIELKYTNWSSFRKIGIATLADFIHCDKTIFKNDLLLRWDELLFHDPTSQIPERWTAYSNANFWREKRDKVSRTAFSYQFKRLRTLNAKNGQNLQAVIKQLVSDKLSTCMNT